MRRSPLFVVLLLCLLATACSVAISDPTFAVVDAEVASDAPPDSVEDGVGEAAGPNASLAVLADDGSQSLPVRWDATLQIRHGRAEADGPGLTAFTAAAAKLCSGLSTIIPFETDFAAHPLFLAELRELASADCALFPGVEIAPGGPVDASSWEDLVSDRYGATVPRLAEADFLALADGLCDVSGTIEEIANDAELSASEIEQLKAIVEHDDCRVRHRDPDALVTVLMASEAIPAGTTVGELLATPTVYLTATTLQGRLVAVDALELMAELAELDPDLGLAAELPAGEQLVASAFVGAEQPERQGTIRTEPLSFEQVLVVTERIAQGTSVAELLEAPTVYLAARSLPAEVASGSALHSILDLTQIPGYVAAADIRPGEQLTIGHFVASGSFEASVEVSIEESSESSG